MDPFGLNQWIDRDSVSIIHSFLPMIKSIIEEQNHSDFIIFEEAVQSYIINYQLSTLRAPKFQTQNELVPSKYPSIDRILRCKISLRPVPNLSMDFAIGFLINCRRKFQTQTRNLIVGLRHGMNLYHQHPGHEICLEILGNCNFSVELFFTPETPIHELVQQFGQKVMEKRSNS